MTNNNGVITFSGNVTTVYQYSFAGFSAEPNTETLASLKTATSISFKVRGDGKTYKVMLPTSDIGDFSYYLTTFTAGAAETPVTIDLSEFTAPGWGQSSEGTSFDQAKVENIQWQTNDGASGAFSLTISDLALN